MINKAKNTFFTKDVFETGIGLDINEDVLKRIYSDKVKPSDKLPIEFFFITDSEGKAMIFKDYLVNNFQNYKSLLVKRYNENYEVSGITEPVSMNLLTINEWNQTMWDIGYVFDCKLDGWQVGV